LTVTYERYAVASSWRKSSGEPMARLRLVIDRWSL
jgi:hypothetical protein